jgi:hypothetical protein
MNPVVQENLRPGTADWRLDRPATGRQIEGYASATSVARGDAIALFVHTTEPHYRLEVFRMGWYQGLGARRVFGPAQVDGTAQTMPSMDPATGLVDCAWEEPFMLRTADADDACGWPSGVYLARLTAGRSGRQSYIVFIVRDDTRAAPLLMQLSVTTWQAYNAWGGKSLYHWGSSDAQRACKLSFNRPYAANAQNPAAAFGMGAGEFLANLQPHPEHYGTSNAGWEVNMLRWLEREGFDVGYCSNLDTHARPELLLRSRAWLSVGHDEYWSAEMRNHVEAARDAGVHLGFFCANSAYWQVRLEPSAASGSADRIMVCHKKARRDTDAEPGRATDKWRSTAVARPEEALIGVMYAGDPVDGDIVVDAPEHWVFDGTGLARGDRLAGLLGYEVDCVHGHGPAGVAVLAASPWKAANGADLSGVAHMAVHTAASGALVFATGSIQWAWGLDDFNVPELRSARSSTAAQRITRNVLARFLADR